MSDPFLYVLVESGYDLEYHIFYCRSTAEEMVASGATIKSSGEISHQHYYLYLFMWKFGDVFVSASTHLLYRVGSGVVRDAYSQVALLIHSKEQLLEKMMESAPCLGMRVLSANQKVTCMGDPNNMMIVDEYTPDRAVQATIYLYDLT